MTSTITDLPFFGGELSTFDPLDASTLETTTAGSFDATKARCSIKVLLSSSGFTSPKWANASPYWNNFEIFFSGATTPDLQSIFYFYDNAGTLIADIQEQSVGVGPTLTMRTLQGGVMTAVGSSVAFGAGTLQRVSVKLVAGAGGSVEFYLSGTLRWTATGLNHSGWAGVGQIKGTGSFAGGQDIFYSQLIGKATSTVGNFVITDDLDTESGAPNNAWTGDVGDINEIVLNDATFIFTDTADDISTFYDSTLDLGTYNVLARGVASRTRVQDAGPTGCQLVLESGGTNYFSTTKTLATGFEALFNSWTLNPNGNVVWTVATAENTKGGVKAIA